MTNHEETMTMNTTIATETKCTKSQTACENCQPLTEVERGQKHGWPGEMVARPLAKYAYRCE